MIHPDAMPRRLRSLAQNVLPKPVFEAAARHKRDVLFFWIPKAAGTSIYNVLLMYGCPKHRWLKPTKPFSNKGFMTFGHVHMPALVQAGIVSEKYLRNAFKFAFVRNPFDRLVSLFFHHKKLKSPDVPEAITFEEFCSVVASGKILPPGLYNYEGLNRCNPQVSWLMDEGKLVVDFIGRYENLATDFDKVCGLIGIPPQEMPHKNKTVHAPYRDYYNSRTRALVEEFYKHDLEAFEYVF